MTSPRTAAACALFALGIASLGPGCAKTTCARGDAECYLDHIQIEDQNGHPLDVVIVPAVHPKTQTAPPPQLCNGKVCNSPSACVSTAMGDVCTAPCSSTADCPSGQTCTVNTTPSTCVTTTQPTQESGVSCGTGFCPPDHPLCYGSLCYAFVDVGTSPVADQTPAITNTPAPVTFDTSGSSVTIELDFTDPLACQPAFCFTPCPANVECATRSACTHSAADGKLAGAVIMTLGPTYEPADGANDSIDMHVVPVAQPGCGDAAQTLQTGDDSAVQIGSEVHLAITVQAPPSSGNDTGGDTNTQCSAFGGGTCSTCSMQACASAGSDGSCAAWYQGSDGSRFDCSGCSSCTAAAQEVVSHCCPTN